MSERVWDAVDKIIRDAKAGARAALQGESFLRVSLQPDDDEINVQMFRNGEPLGAIWFDLGQIDEMIAVFQDHRTALARRRAKGG